MNIQLGRPTKVIPLVSAKGIVISISTTAACTIYRCEEKPFSKPLVLELFSLVKHIEIYKILSFT